MVRLMCMHSSELYQYKKSVDDYAIRSVLKWVWCANSKDISSKLGSKLISMCKNRLKKSSARLFSVHVCGCFESVGCSSTPRTRKYGTHKFSSQNMHVSEWGSCRKYKRFNKSLINMLYNVYFRIYRSHLAQRKYAKIVCNCILHLRDLHGFSWEYVKCT